jgi:hypothetical protein
MRNRSPGESLPRRIIRLQRARRCRRRPPCPDIERRTLKCAPSPHRPAVRVPARFFAATSISWTSICRRCPSSRIHKRRDKSVLTSISHLTTPPDVSPAINLLQCGLLPDLSDHRNWTQAQLSGARGVNAIRTTFFGTTFEPIRAGNRKRLTCSSLATGLLPSPVPASASLATAAYFTSNTSPPSSQHSPQQETADGWCAALTHPASRTPQRCRRPGHACARTKTPRPETQIHARRRPASSRPEREEEPDLEANRRLLPGAQLRNAAGAILHEAQS